MFLPGESQGRGSLVGCRLWGRTESDTTEATSQQQQQHHSFSPKTQSLLFKKLFIIYLFQAVLGLCWCVGFPLAAEIGGYSPAAVHGSLIAGAPLVAGQGL